MDDDLAITAYERPTRFVDEQVNGPFGRWRHEHTFTPDGTDTVMTDRIEFAAPLAPLGRLAERGVLIHYMTRLIRERNDAVRAAAESQAITPRRQLEHGG